MACMAPYADPLKLFDWWCWVRMVDALCVCVCGVAYQHISIHLLTHGLPPQSSENAPEIAWLSYLHVLTQLA